MFSSIFILLFALQIHSIYSIIDFCNSDPRLNITYHDCASSPSDASKNILIYQPKLDHHPYHALLEGLWPISYYLNYCIKRNEQVTLAIPYDCLLDCLLEEECKKASSTIIWQKCALAAILSNLRHIKIKIVHLDSAECYDKRIFMNQLPSMQIGIGLGKISYHYRDISWYGRQCIGNEKNECIHNNNVTEFEHTQLIELPFNYKRRTVNYIRKSLQTFLNITKPIRPDGMNRVNVLVYDRNDTNRRQWSNAQRLVRRLEQDSRLNVNYIKRMPTSFHDQGKTYAWADILISPHGGSMINTFFMYSDCDILEIWSKCNHDVAASRFLPKPWTGSHAHLLDHHLTYIQCHAKSLPYKKYTELENEDGPEVLEPHKSNPNEIMYYFQFAIRRQILKLNRPRIELLHKSSFNASSSSLSPVTAELSDKTKSFVEWIDMALYVSALSAIMTSYFMLSKAEKRNHTGKLNKKHSVFVSKKRAFGLSLS